MKICICAPIEIAPYKDWIPDDEFDKYKDVGIVGSSAVNQLARGLLDAGHDVTLVSLNKDIEKPVKIEGKRLHIRIGVLRKGAWRLSGIYGQERRYMCAELCAAEPEIVHAHWTYEYALAGLDSHLPLVITVRDWAPVILKLLPDKGYRLFRLLLNNFVMAKGYYFIANSPYIQSRLQKKLGREIPLIPNSFNDHEFSEGPKVHSSNTKIFVAVLYGLDKRKNTAGLLKSFQIVRRKLPDVELWAIGRGLEVGGIAHNWAKEKGLDCGVNFIGPMKHKEVIKKISDADVLVHPALEESFGNPVLEAMSRGLPCIGGRESGAVPWILENNKSGMLCDVYNPVSIADAMVRIISDPITYNRIAEAGYRRAYNDFRVSVIVERTINVYNSVIRRWN